MGAPEIRFCFPLRGFRFSSRTEPVRIFCVYTLLYSGRRRGEPASYPRMLHPRSKRNKKYLRRPSSSALNSQASVTVASRNPSPPPTTFIFHTPHHSSYPLLKSSIYYHLYRPGEGIGRYRGYEAVVVSIVVSRGCVLAVVVPDFPLCLIWYSATGELSSAHLFRGADPPTVGFIAAGCQVAGGFF